MRAAVVTAYGGLEVFKVVNDFPVPKITKPDEVLIKVAYAGVNPTDTYTRQGYAFRIDPPKPPYAPGKDGSGIVEKVGSAVTLVKKGDRVWFTAERSGATAEYVVTPVVYPLPKNVTLAEGAGIGIPYLTAYRAFFQKGHPGQSVLVHGASGGVGTAAVQIAKANGNIVAGTAGTPEGIALVRSLGAKVVVNHREKGYEKELLKEFPNGFNHIAENAAHFNLDRDIGLVAKDGEISIIGNRTPTEVNAVGLMAKEASVFGVALFYASAEELLHAALAINKIFESGVKPVIDKVYEIDEIAKAHEYIISSPGAKGNHVVRVVDLE